jgi:hypothetical protein
MSERISRKEHLIRRIRELNHQFEGLIILDILNKGNGGISLDDAKTLLDSLEIDSSDPIFKLNIQGPPNDDAGSQHDQYLYGA